MIRYPFAPLAAAMGVSENAACRLLRLSGSTEQEYRRLGVSDHVGERLATAAGLHPFGVWPEMADDRIASMMVECAACGEGFMPVRSNHKFCSQRCGNRVRMREASRVKRRTDEAYRLSEIARVRAYYLETIDYQRGQARRRYRANREAA